MQNSVLHRTHQRLYNTSETNLCNRVDQSYFGADHLLARTKKMLSEILTKNPKALHDIKFAITTYMGSESITKDDLLKNLSSCAVGSDVQSLVEDLSYIKAEGEISAKSALFEIAGLQDKLTIWLKTFEIEDHATKVINQGRAVRKIERLGQNIGYVYTSKSGDPSINLNGQVFDNQGGEIVCRHLAFNMLLNDKTYHATMLKLEMSQPTTLAENIYDTELVEYRANEYHPFQLNQFGAALHSTCKNMQPNDKKSMLLFSERHAMAVVVWHKGDHISLKFYDPNMTTSHFRYLTHNLEDLQNLQLGDFLEKNIQKDYFSSIDGGVLAVYDNPHHLAVAKKSVANFVWSQNIAELRNSKELSVLLFYALHFNAAEEHIIKIVTQIINLTDATNITQTLHFLKAKQMPDGFSGLFVAMQKNHIFAAAGYINAILNSKHLRLNEKVELLLAEDMMDNPALCAALAFGNTEAAILFVSSILDSDLPPEQKTILLTAKDGNGDSGWPIIAMKPENALLIATVKELICASSLPTECKQQILNCISD